MVQFPEWSTVMTINEENTEPAMLIKPGIKHWLWQIIPPVLMLAVLLATDNGAALVFLLGIFVIPALISILSVIAKLIFFHKRKYFLPRPLLTLAVFMLVFISAQWSYSVARDQARVAAGMIHDQCNMEILCPIHPHGWEIDGSRVSRRFGIWFTYPATYMYRQRSFVIHLQQGFDLGDNITGGDELELEVKRNVDK